MLGMIFAMGPKGEFGCTTGLGMPWDLPEDRKSFAKTTAQSTLIMSKATFDAVGLLPNRRTYVHEFESLIEKSGDREWIIGGRKLIRDNITQADIIRVTFVDEDRIVEDDSTVFLDVGFIENMLDKRLCVGTIEIDGAIIRTYI